MKKISYFHFPEDVRGLISYHEGKLLYRLAQVKPKLGTVVELGAFEGRSTICLAQGSKKVNGGKIVTIDKFTGDSFTGQKPDYFPQFKKNIWKYRLSDWITGLSNDSVKAAQNWNKPIRFLFVDAGHSYKQVKADFSAWEKYVTPKGIIAFHDSLYWPDVNRFVSSLILNHNYQYLVTFTKNSTGITVLNKKKKGKKAPLTKRISDFLKFKRLSWSFFLSHSFLTIRGQDENQLRYKLALLMKKVFQRLI